MKNASNISILECPSCKKPLVNIASKVKRVNPIAHFIVNYHTKIIIYSAIFSTFFLWMVYEFEIFGYKRGAAYAWFTLVLMPPLVMYFLLRCFSLYRVTNCPYCGYYEEQKLGRSNTA